MTDITEKIFRVDLVDGNQFNVSVNNEALFAVEVNIPGVAPTIVPAGGTTGQHLAKASGDDYDMEWVAEGGAVDSVFGRTGAVVAAASDYDASQVDNDSGQAGATVAAALDGLVEEVAYAEPHANPYGRQNGVWAEVSPKGHAHKVDEISNPIGVHIASWDNVRMVLQDLHISGGEGAPTLTFLTVGDISSQTTAAPFSAAALTVSCGLHALDDVQVDGDLYFSSTDRLAYAAGTLDFNGDLTLSGTFDQLDTHAALTNEHIDWTGATANFQTTGTAKLVNTAVTASALLTLDEDIAFTAYSAVTHVGLDLDTDISIASGQANLDTFTAIRHRFTVVDNGASYTNTVIQILDSVIDADNIAINAGTPPVKMVFSNPATAQAFSDGFMLVDVTGGTGTTVAVFSIARATGAGSAIGYKGYATADAAGTGALCGVQGYVFPNGAGNHSELVAVDCVRIGGGGTAADKHMGLRSNSHALVRTGSMAVASTNAATPNALSPGHVDFLNNTGELYVEEDVEIDGELFMDGNESHSLVETTTTPYTAAGITYIMVDASGGNKVVDLPAISGVTSRMYVVKKIDSSGNTVTVDGNSSETIDGATTQVISTQYDVLRMIAGGTEWHLV